MARWTLMTLLLAWVGAALWVFSRFSPLAYGTTPLSKEQVLSLKWKDTWDFIVHKP